MRSGNPKILLSKQLNREVRSYAAVGGHFSDWMVDFALHSGYESFATMIPGKTSNNVSNISKIYRNHLQASHDEIYIKNLIESSNWFFLKNKLRYYALYLLKVVLGMRNYDRIKSFVLGSADVAPNK